MRVSLKIRELKSGRRSFYLDIRQPGKPRAYESLGLMLTGDRLQDRETKKRAQAIRDIRFNELHGQQWGRDPAEGRQTSFFDYADAIMREKKSEHTRLVWRMALKHFKGFMGRDDATFGALDPETMRKFKNYLEERLSGYSAAAYYTKIKAVFNRAILEDKIAKNPAIGIKFSKVQRPEPTHLDLAEIRALSKAQIINATVKNAFLFSCFTGLRFSDIVALTKDRIVGDRVKFRQQKTKGDLTVPLSEQAQKILKAQLPLAKGDRIFPLPSETTTNGGLRVLAKRAGLKKHIHFHVARHTFATLALTAGVDLYTVSKLLGHRSISTTQIYAQVMDAGKKAAIEKLPKL